VSVCASGVCGACVGVWVWAWVCVWVVGVMSGVYVCMCVRARVCVCGACVRTGRSVTEGGRL